MFLARKKVGGRTPEDDSTASSEWVDICCWILAYVLVRRATEFTSILKLESTNDRINWNLGTRSWLTRILNEIVKQERKRGAKTQLTHCIKRESSFDVVEQGEERMKKEINDPLKFLSVRNNPLWQGINWRCKQLKAAPMIEVGRPRSLWLI